MVLIPRDLAREAGSAHRRIRRSRVWAWLLLALVFALPATAHAGAIDWKDPIRWRSWPEAQKESAASRKPVCLVVYANWCPRCRELAPAFADPEVVKLAKDLVMVRQDGDAKPAWLAEKVGRFGGYVPRIFFLRPDGTVAEDITSGHARYPYFYQPAHIDALRASMRKAAQLGGKATGKR